ncbi:hypothetical protein GF351_00045 [Candidatus Woesearchaeota archaeon]|nr:hypothetical protein [Candidatus Woesearchaeota archaeon]
MEEKHNKKESHMKESHESDRSAEELLREAEENPSTEEEASKQAHKNMQDDTSEETGQAEENASREQASSEEQSPATAESEDKYGQETAAQEDQTDEAQEGAGTKSEPAESKPEQKAEGSEPAKEPEAKKKPFKLSKVGIWQAISALLFLLLLISIFTDGFGITGGAVANTDDISEKVRLDFYVMSQCPYGTQVEDGIKPVLDEMGEHIDFNLEFIMYPKENYAGREDQFCIEDMCAMHGIPEVRGNMVQLCAARHNPDSYMNMITCMNKDPSQIPENWETCAQDNGLDVDAIKACYEGEEGLELLRQSAAKAQAAGATGSPTIYLNNQSYSGGRDKKAFMTAICNAFEGEKPEACSQIPEPGKVSVVVLNDERCEECDTKALVGQLKSMFPGLELTELDYSDDQGKEIYEEAGLKALPALLFEESVKEESNYARISNYMEAKGDYLSLRIAAKFDPTAEICDNGIDDTGNSLIDCQDPTCKEKMVCRKEITEKLDVFVMSQCPYGTLALDAMEQVLENFGDSIDFDIHYIATENPDGTFNSLHGQPEVDENIRELCAIEHYPEDFRYMDYIWCRNKDITSTDWESCAEEAGMNSSVIKLCFEGDEGKTLLSENIKLAQSLGIGASPTWLANNKFQFSGIDAETVKQQYCKANPGLKGCENTLSSDTGGVAAGSC